MSALVAEWKPDCQGKQDYDAELVSLSTRYYPSRTGIWTDNTFRPGIAPSAIASIYIQEDEVLRRYFSGETEADVKQQVETWSKEQFQRIRAAVLAAVAPPAGVAA